MGHTFICEQNAFFIIIVLSIQSGIKKGRSEERSERGENGNKTILALLNSASSAASILLGIPFGIVPRTDTLQAPMTSATIMWSRTLMKLRLIRLPSTSPQLKRIQHLVDILFLIHLESRISVALVALLGMKHSTVSLVVLGKIQLSTDHS